MLFLNLTAINFESVRGIYTIGGKPNRMPARALYLHPHAAHDFARIADRVTVSDMFRTAESSLAAVKAKRGALPPGYSAHNFGLAIDVDVSPEALKRAGVPNKAQFDGMMAAHGFFCHRNDHKVGFEAWHYTWLGVGYQRDRKAKNLGAETERVIQLYYGDRLTPDAVTCQKMLARLNFYSGAFDGIIGPLSRAAIEAFGRAWMPGTRVSISDRRFKRTLALISATRLMMPATKRGEEEAAA